MKVLILFAILATLGTVLSTPYVTIHWVDKNVGTMNYDGGDCGLGTYKDYCTESSGWSFAPGDYEIGSANVTLSLGKSLFLSVQFLGPDQFSRFTTASTLGMDYFSLTKTANLQIDEIFDTSY